MKTNHYENATRKLAEYDELPPQKRTSGNGGIKIFALHIPMDLYLAAKEVTELRNISMKKYVLEAVIEKIATDRKNGSIIDN